MKLSFSGLRFLQDCRNTTRRYPMRMGYLRRRGRALERKGLVKYRGFDRRLGPGGWYITAAGKAALLELVPTCRKCGCTDADCSGCVQRTGSPCHWVERDLCSACVT